MPVVVTGADSALGALVVAALIGAAADLRATVDDRGAVAPLLSQGVKTAVSDLVDTERFGAVLEDAHTVIHLRGDDEGSVLDGLADVLAAAPDSGVQRVITVVGLGGGSDDHDQLRALEGSEYDTVVFELGVILAPLVDPRATLPAYDDPHLPVAPLWVGDLVDAIVAADRLRDLHGHVRVPAVGADVVTSAQLVAMLGGAPAPLAAGETRGGGLVGDRGEALRSVLGIVPRPLDDAVRLALDGL